jgi:hypothetical protein
MVGGIVTTPAQAARADFFPATRQAEQKALRQVPRPGNASFRRGGGSRIHDLSPKLPKTVYRGYEAKTSRIRDENWPSRVLNGHPDQGGFISRTTLSFTGYWLSLN